MSSSQPPAGPPSPYSPGDVIAGKYAFERVIGAGGMGMVLAARHLELDEPVAIKMLLPHVPPTGEPAARFLREAKAAIKIKRDHVVRVLDVGRTETGSPYIVMEYLEGCDLGQLVERSGRLPVDDVVEYVLQACEAIASAHVLGIVHRDLKPANLFLARAGDGSPCVKVLDFGISKFSEPASGQPSGLTSTATVMGTPCFMSPEQLRSTRDVDARTDLWSMGAILHALLTGGPPYDGESNADVSAKIIRDQPTPLRVLRPDVPAELEALVLRCLEKDPARRIPDVAALAQGLARATGRASSRASAERIAKIATGAAPTMPSLPESPSGKHPLAHPLANAETPAPTRTASAWGDTRREERRGRRIAGLVAAGGIAAGLALFAVLRWQSDPGSVHGASPATSAAAIGSPAPVLAVTATAQAAEPAPVAAAPSPPSATAPVAASAASAPSAAAAPSARTTGRSVPTRTGSNAPPIAPGTAAAAAATTAKPSTGLFDGRE